MKASMNSLDRKTVEALRGKSALKEVLQALSDLNNVNVMLYYQDGSENPRITCVMTIKGAYEATDKHIALTTAQKIYPLSDEQYQELFKKGLITKTGEMVRHSPETWALEIGITKKGLEAANDENNLSG